MLRNPSRVTIQDWLGLNSFEDFENLGPQWWKDSINILVCPTSSAQVMRSPANLNPALSTTNKILSAAAYDRSAGTRIIYDINLTSGSNVATYQTDGTTNTQIRTGQANAAWVSLNINDKLYRINGSEFVQLQSDLSTFYKNGIAAPAAAPSISYVAGGTGNILDGIDLVYAYRNSNTLHVSRPSPTSNRLGATGANHKIRIPTVASGETGVDGIVFFLTVDGGSIRYLLVDSNGDPVVAANATANVDIDISTILRDTLTPEPSFNFTPPTTATSMFRWKDRIFLLGFPGATARQQVQYSGFESTYIGQPWESWPQLNIVNIPNKADSAVAGIETRLGALVLGEKDSYLLAGYPSDKTTGPETGIAITEHMEPLGWKIGTKSPKTLKNTPFGPMWLDQNKRIQFWDGDGSPREAALPIRDRLDSILDANLSMAEAEWFQHGKNGGYYVLTASTSGSTNNQIFFITVYRDPVSNEQRFGYGVSDVAAQCLVTAIVTKQRMFFGGTDRLFEILDPSLAGAGWSNSSSRFFEIVLGNDQTYSYWHSMRFDGDNTGLTVTVRNPDGTEEQEVFLEQDPESGSSWAGLLDAYGRRKILKFSFDTVDTLRQIKNLQVWAGAKKRAI